MGKFLLPFLSTDHIIYFSSISLLTNEKIFIKMHAVVVPHYKYCFISYNTTITSILFSAIITFLVVMLLHLGVSRKSQNNLELAAKN